MDDEEDTTNEVTYWVIGEFAWGHNPELGKAKRNFVEALGDFVENDEQLSGYTYNVIEFPVGISFMGVDGMGRVSWGGDTENVKPIPHGVNKEGEL